MLNPRKKLAQNAIQLAAAGVAALGAGKLYYHFVAPAPPSGPPTERSELSLRVFTRQYDGILGTSMDLLVRAAIAAEANDCEWRILAEIERLRGLLSTYDPASEISRVQAGAPMASPELAGLLAAYQVWSDRTAGALHANMGGVIRLWLNAARTDTLPLAEELQNALAEKPALNVDALGKAFIIDRAVDLARRLVPAGLLNIGGDIRVWGADTWHIGVANPAAPAENAPPLTRIALRDGAIATSGGYARTIAIRSHVYSHIIDGRTGWPVSPLAGATMTAPDSVTANALSTVATVLGPELGAKLAQQWGALGHLIVDAAGRFFASPQFVAQTTPAATSAANPKASTEKPAATATVKPSGTATPAAAAPQNPWPEHYEVTVNIALKNMSGNGGRGATRPYVAVWVDNAEGKHLRTLAVWGNNGRWQPELTTWWTNAAEADVTALQAVTRATRPAGKYSVVWDGLDEHGKKVGMGTYKIVFEINREHGQHATQTIVVNCGKEAQSLDLKQTPESDASKITYGPAAATPAGTNATPASPGSTASSAQK